MTIKYLTFGDSKIYHLSRFNSGHTLTLGGMWLIDEYHPENNPKGYKRHSSRPKNGTLCKRCKKSAEKRNIET
jgi:hypothetical protein